MNNLILLIMFLVLGCKDPSVKNYYRYSIIVSANGHKLLMDSVSVETKSTRVENPELAATLTFIFDSLVVMKYPSMIPMDSTEYFRHKAESFDELKKRWDDLQRRCGCVDYEYANTKKEIEL